MRVAGYWIRDLRDGRTSSGQRTRQPLAQLDRNTKSVFRVFGLSGRLGLLLGGRVGGRRRWRNRFAWRIELLAGFYSCNLRWWRWRRRNRDSNGGPGQRPIRKPLALFIHELHADNRAVGFILNPNDASSKPPLGDFGVQVGDLEDLAKFDALFDDNADATPADVQGPPVVFDSALAEELDARRYFTACAATGTTGGSVPGPISRYLG